MSRTVSHTSQHAAAIDGAQEEWCCPVVGREPDSCDGAISMSAGVPEVQVARAGAG